MNNNIIYRNACRGSLVFSHPGTNDLGCGEDPDNLLTAICKMHDRAKETKAKTVALAIPQFSLELVRK